MMHSRRVFLKTGVVASAALASSNLPAATTKTCDHTVISREIISLFNALPGDKALKIFAPSVKRNPQFLVQSNSGKRLFVASAIKTFVLCEALRQADSPDIVEV